MKKNYFFIFLFLVTHIVSSQRSVKIGYIDTEYILENLPEYNQVSERLEEKAAGWKKEIEDRTRKIDQKKEALNSERILLTWCNMGRKKIWTFSRGSQIFWFS